MKFLFVCTGNICRSPMAEALAKKHFGTGVFVQSAGINAGEPDGFMHQVMQELDIDMSSHQPTTIDELEDDFFDIIITLSPEAHHRTLEWASVRGIDVEYWPTHDPSTVAGSREQVVDAYRATRDGIDNRIIGRFEINKR